jgi:predicted CoA-binding protein
MAEIVENVVYDDIDAFLKLTHIAIYGLSEQKDRPANKIAEKMQHAGYQVSLLHPRMNQLGGLQCYKQLSELPVSPEGVFIFTNPRHTESIVEDCIGIKPEIIWMHNMLGVNTQFGKGVEKKTSSVSGKAVERARAAGIRVIHGSCPMQFIPPVDPFHRCLRWFNDKVNMQPSDPSGG